MTEFAWTICGALLFASVTLLCVVGIEQVGLRERIGWRSRVPGFLMNLAGTVGTVFLAWPISTLWHALGIPVQLTLPIWQLLAPLGWFGSAVHVLFLALFADFLCYWRHRAEHRLLWRIHAVHHSPRELHATNDIGHPLQLVANFIFVTIPLSLVAVDGPGLPLAIGLLMSMLSIYIHSPVEVHLGLLRRFVVDNRFHRIHHSLDERHFDKNFGICFSCWDYLFGTAYDPKDEWPAVGLADVPAPRTIRDYLLIPFRPTTAATKAEPRPNEASLA